MNLTTKQTFVSRIIRLPQFQSQILPSTSLLSNTVVKVHTTSCKCNSTEEKSRDSTTPSTETADTEVKYDPNKYGDNTVRDPGLKHGPKEALGNLRHTISPTKVQKFILVWVKKYESMNDVPEKVGLSTMNMSKDIARIKLLFYMFFATFVACGLTISYGKELSKSGKSIEAADELRILEMRVAYLREQKERLKKERELQLQKT